MMHSWKGQVSTIKMPDVCIWVERFITFGFKLADLFLPQCTVQRTDVQQRYNTDAGMREVQECACMCTCGSTAGHLHYWRIYISLLVFTYFAVRKEHLELLFRVDLKYQVMGILNDIYAHFLTFSPRLLLFLAEKHESMMKSLVQLHIFIISDISLTHGQR